MSEDKFDQLQCFRNSFKNILPLHSATRLTNCDESFKGAMFSPVISSTDKNPNPYAIKAFPGPKIDVFHNL